MICRLVGCRDEWGENFTGLKDGKVMQGVWRKEKHLRLLINIGTWCKHCEIPRQSEDARYRDFSDPS